jgi:hypothetical protein
MNTRGIKRSREVDLKSISTIKKKARVESDGNSKLFTNHMMAEHLIPEIFSRLPSNLPPMNVYNKTEFRKRYVVDGKVNKGRFIEAVKFILDNNPCYDVNKYIGNVNPAYLIDTLKLSEGLGGKQLEKKDQPDSFDFLIVTGLFGANKQEIVCSFIIANLGECKEYTNSWVLRIICNSSVLFPPAFGPRAVYGVAGYSKELGKRWLNERMDNPRVEYVTVPNPAMPSQYIYKMIPDPADHSRLIYAKTTAEPDTSRPRRPAGSSANTCGKMASYLIGAFCYAAKCYGNGQGIALLELANGYDNAMGFCLYEKFGFQETEYIDNKTCKAFGDPNLEMKVNLFSITYRDIVITAISNVKTRNESAVPKHYFCNLGLSNIDEQKEFQKINKNIVKYSMESKALAPNSVEKIVIDEKLQAEKKKVSKFREVLDSSESPVHNDLQ